MVHGDRCVVWIARGMLCGVCELWRGSRAEEVVRRAELLNRTRSSRVEFRRHAAAFWLLTLIEGALVEARLDGCST